MAEYKVLGASDRNLKAIEMALSMGGGKSVNGEVIPDFHYKEEKEEIVKQEIPTSFKLSIVDKGNQQFLRIERGDVTVYASYVHKFYVFYTYDDYGEGHDIIPLSGYFNDNSTHYVDVVLSVQINSHWYDDVETSLFFGTEILRYPDGPGLKHYVLGRLKRDSNGKWSVSSQDINSDIFIHECDVKDTPFKIWLNRIGSVLDMTLVSGRFNFQDYQITVNGGYILSNRDTYPFTTYNEVNSRDFALTSSSYSNSVYLKYNFNPTSGQILTYDELPATTDYRFLKLGDYSVPLFNGGSFPSFTQNFSGNIGSGERPPYLVKAYDDDSKPGTLFEKLKAGRGIRIWTDYFDSGGQFVSVNVSGATPLDSQILKQIDQLNGEGYIYFSNGHISLRTPSNNN